MKRIILLIPAVVLSVSSAESDIEVIEVFRAETVEELEAALTDGYPMPWLEEILNDETIPEEDRYWLDCRVRAVIAQDLHLFYDREGNPVHVEAKWIAPGEDYWREHVMVRPVLPFEDEENQSEDQSSSDGILNLSNDNYSDEYIREPFNENSPTLMSDPPGEILNLYGERVGELAVVNRYVVLSRDASIGAVQSGGNERICNWDRTPYACILYPDGSFREIPFDSTGQYRAAINEDGSIIVFVCIDTYTMAEFDITDAWVMDNLGNIIYKITPPDEFYNISLPQISPSGKYCCYTVETGELGVMNCFEGKMHSTITPIDHNNLQNSWINFSRFSPDGNYLCIGGHTIGLVINLETQEYIWQSQARIRGNDFSTVWCSENAKCIAVTMRRGNRPDYYYEHEVYINNHMIYNSVGYDMSHEEIVVSPNGTFLLTCEDDEFRINDTSLPIHFQIITGGE